MVSKAKKSENTEATAEAIEAQHAHVQSVTTDAPAVLTPEQIEAGRQAYAAFVAQYGAAIAAAVVPVDVAQARIENAKAENAAEILSLESEIAEIKALIAPLDARLKPLFVRLTQLKGGKAKPAAGESTDRTCLECGQGRHSTWKDKANGVLNQLTANCKTYAAKKAAEAN